MKDWQKKSIEKQIDICVKMFEALNPQTWADDYEYYIKAVDSHRDSILDQVMRYASTTNEAREYQERIDTLIDYDV